MTVLLSDPSNLAANLALAVAGDTIKLSPGNYGTINLKNRNWSPAVTLDAKAAQFTSLMLYNVVGLTIIGGTYGPSIPGMGNGYGVGIRQCQQVTMAGGKFASLDHGIVLDHSKAITVRNNVMTVMRVDGIDVAQCQQVLLDGNILTGFTPTGLQHPDGIQLWSRPDMVCTDVTITNNIVVGDCQGISGFNHVRNGVDDGGFDRLTVSNNFICVSYPQALHFASARASTVTNNTIQTMPGSLYRASFYPPTDGASVVTGNTIGAKR